MFSTWQMAHDCYLRDFQNLVAGAGGVSERTGEGDQRGFFKEHKMEENHSPADNTHQRPARGAAGSGKKLKALRDDSNSLCSQMKVPKPFLAPVSL